MAFSPFGDMIGSLIVVSSLAFSPWKPDHKSRTSARPGLYTDSPTVRFQDLLDDCKAEAFVRSLRFRRISFVKDIRKLVLVNAVAVILNGYLRGSVGCCPGGNGNGSTALIGCFDRVKKKVQ